MTSQDFLASVDLCSGLTEEELSKLWRCCRPDSRTEGERIFVDGEEAEDICFVASGQVDLRYDLPGRETSKETTVSTVEAGGAFGWSALVPPHRYTLSSYAVGGPCQLLRVGSASLRGLFETEPRIGYVFMTNLAKLIGRRFHALEDELARNLGFDVMHRW